MGNIDKRVEIFAEQQSLAKKKFRKDPAARIDSHSDDEIRRISRSIRLKRVRSGRSAGNIMSIRWEERRGGWILPSCAQYILAPAKLDSMPMTRERWPYS